jgi:hypothetical protein
MLIFEQEENVRFHDWECADYDGISLDGKDYITGEVDIKYGSGDHKMIYLEFFLRCNDVRWHGNGFGFGCSD